MKRFATHLALIVLVAVATVSCPTSRDCSHAVTCSTFISSTRTGRPLPSAPLYPLPSLVTDAQEALVSGILPEDFDARWPVQAR